MFLRFSSNGAVAFLVSKYFFFQLSRAVRSQGRKEQPQNSVISGKFDMFCALIWGIHQEFDLLQNEWPSRGFSTRIIETKGDFRISYFYCHVKLYCGCAHLGSCGVCSGPTSLSPFLTTLASSTPAAFSPLSPAWFLLLVPLLKETNHVSCVHIIEPIINPGYL